MTDRILPTNLGALLAMLISAGLLIDRVKNRGKKEGVDEATVNGLGVRISKTETNIDRLFGQFAEHQRTVDRVLGANENLLKEIGHAEKGASQCREDYERFTIEIGTKVDDMRRELSGKIGELAIQLKGVETEVKLRAQFDERDNRRR